MFELEGNKNELEVLLDALHNNQIEGSEFISLLLTCQVFMPIFEKHRITGLQESARPKPLLLKDESGIDVMALFTSPDRAKPVVKDYEGYGGGLMADFHWVLGIVEQGWGMSINPGLKVGIDLEPDMVQQLIDSQKEQEK